MESRPADALAEALSRAGVVPSTETFRALFPGSEELVRAALRLAAVVAVLARAPVIAAAAAAAAAAGELLAAELRHPPMPGPTTVHRSVEAQILPSGPTDEPPVVVVAPLAHTVGPSGAHALSAALGVAALAALAFVAPSPARAVALAVGAEPLLRIALLGRGITPPAPTAPAAVLAGVARLAAKRSPVRPLWLLGIPSEAGLRRFLSSRPELAREAWVVVLERAAAGDLTLVSGARALVRRDAHPAVVRAVAGAALDTGDAVDVRRFGAVTGLQAAALARGVPAVTLTLGPGDGDTERAARLLHRLSRTAL